MQKSHCKFKYMLTYDKSICLQEHSVSLVHDLRQLLWESYPLQKLKSRWTNEQYFQLQLNIHMHNSHSHTALKYSAQFTELMQQITDLPRSPIDEYHMNLYLTRMWANAERDGCPVKYSWRPLFNAAKFSWRPLLECRAVTKPRRETRWNLLGCLKQPNRSQPLVGRSSPYYEDMRRTYCLTSFFSDCRYVP